MIPLRYDPNEDQTWRLSAACAGLPTDAWYSRDASDRLYAKRVCGQCSVRDACLAWAVNHPAATTYGIWGGLTDTERERLLRERTTS